MLWILALRRYRPQVSHLCAENIRKHWHALYARQDMQRISRQAKLQGVHSVCLLVDGYSNDNACQTHRFGV